MFEDECEHEQDCINSVNNNSKDITIAKYELIVLSFSANDCFFPQITHKQIFVGSFFLTKYYCFYIEYASLFLWDS